MEGERRVIFKGAEVEGERGGIRKEKSENGREMGVN